MNESICICATFTAEPVKEALAFWAAELRSGLDVRFAPYGQVFQELLDPGGMLAGNQSGANVVLLRPEDWGRGAVVEAAEQVLAAAVAGER